MKPMRTAIKVAIAVVVVVAAVVVVRMIIPPVMVQTCADTGDPDTSFCTTRPADR
jgi:hypothetical protein